MAIDSTMPAFREIPAATAVPQASLTRRDRELQVEEGQAPIEVAAAEHEALCWRKGEDLQEKWKKRRKEREANGSAVHGGPVGNVEDDDESNRQAQAETMQESEEYQEEETGTLFDGRS